MHKDKLHIAIDGPVAAGKGTVAKMVAQRLGLFYVDTGAMYRTLALLAERAGIAWTDESRLAAVADTIDFELRSPNDQEQDGRSTTVVANGEDVSWLIRTQHLAKGGSLVSKFDLVRRILVKKQQELASDRGVVMEGRDTTYRVLPNADIKVFLTASLEERARRRFQELTSRGQKTELVTVQQEIETRDGHDANRTVDPLKIVPDAVVIDSTELSIDQVVDRILELVSQTKR